MSAPLGQRPATVQGRDLDAAYSKQNDRDKVEDSHPCYYAAGVRLRTRRETALDRWFEQCIHRHGDEPKGPERLRSDADRC